MARCWKEKLDVTKHCDHMKVSCGGGFPIQAPADNIIDRWVYFVSVCSFTFEFQSLEQIDECLSFFSQKVRPNSMQPSVTLEHYWQDWDERIPYWLFEEPKRQKVVKALEAALDKFES